MVLSGDDVLDVKRHVVVTLMNAAVFAAVFGSVSDSPLGISINHYELESEIWRAFCCRTATTSIARI